MILQHLRSQNNSYSTTVLIDDYSMDRNHNGVNHKRNEILTLFGKEGLTPDSIFFESSFAGYADKIIESFSPKLLHRRGDHLFLTNKGEDLYSYQIPPRNRRHKAVFLKKINRIPIDKSDPSEPLRVSVTHRQQSITDTLLYIEKNDTRIYSCPLLASAWYLARLGIKPFSQVIEDGIPQKALPAKTIINVLPISYLKVESAIRDIYYYSRNKKIRDARDRIRYFFH